MKLKCKSYCLFGAVGAVFGLFFPIVFVILDLKELGEEVGFSQISFIINSQNIYLFSIISFPIIFAIIFVLFTKINHANRDLINANEQIKEEKKKSAMNARLASLGILSAGIGHEINNPLAILQGNSDVIKRKLKKLGWLNDDIIERFQINKDTIKRIRDIVNGLRVMARMESTEEELVDSHQNIDQVVKVIKNIYFKEGIEVVSNLDAKEFHFNGNSGKFQQVILNLLGNSKDAIQENQDKGQITVHTYNAEEKVVIKVTDDGCGINKDDLEKIFDTFYTTKEVGKGTGMGLSIVHSIVKDMKGRIHVDSELGEGTTFTIIFPIATRSLEDEKVVDKESKFDEIDFDLPENQLKGKIIIADDEEHIRGALEEILLGFGLEVEAVCDGAEAYDRIKEGQFDLLISDLKMPNMDGTELIQKIKQEEDNKIKVIILTGGIESEYDNEKHQNLLKLVNTYIKKPFFPEEIYSTLKDILNN